MTAGTRVRVALACLLAVMAAGSAGYVALGFSPLEAVYQTVTTVTTVGFREVRPLSTAGQAFTIGLILVGVSTALYTFGVILEDLIEGGLRDDTRRRRMQRDIKQMRGHVVVCGWGRVGRSLAEGLDHRGVDVVVVDQDLARLQASGRPFVHGDATDDQVLLEAGTRRAKALVAAIDTDAENLFVTMSGRALQPDLFIVARARTTSSEEKLRRAGADRVVNPQAIGAERMAAFITAPHVAEFLDVAMRGTFPTFELEEVPVLPGSPLDGGSIASTALRLRTGALIIAVREVDGRFTLNPDPHGALEAGQILIAVGTDEQVRALADHAAAGVDPRGDRP